MADGSKPTTEIDLSGFGLERLAHIGRGQYASAQHVKETSTGATYVAKCVSLAALNDHDQDLAHQEVFLLQTLSHPYIVAYRDSFLVEGANTLVIVMEYCNGGDVRQSIKAKGKSGEHFPEEHIMTWFVQLCLALQYIHSEKVLHRDLKTSNIFLTDNGATIKLGDFGISRVLEGTTEAAVTIVGTPYYMSPEVCRSEPYNWKSDIWALGCVLYELCMLKHAFESSSLLGLVYKIVSDHYDPIPSFYTPQLDDLIHHLLAKSAEARPSINEVFGNPYVKAYLAQQAVPPPAPPEAAPPMLHMQPKRLSSSLRPGGKPLASASMSMTSPPVPGPQELSAQARLFVISSRIRRRLVGHKLNWISAFATFDTDGTGTLSPDAFVGVLTTMHLGLSEVEMVELAQGIGGGAMITVDIFGAYMRDVAPEVQNYETWARQILAPVGKRMRELFQARDATQCGTLHPDIFAATLKELAPMVTPHQLEILLLLADKNGLGDIDYGEFTGAFGPPLAPAAPTGLTPPGMPPLPGMAPLAPPGMPPLPAGAPTPPGMPPLPPGATASLDPSQTVMSGVDLNFDRTFFTCATNQFPGQISAKVSTLSPHGCALIFARIHRRLDGVGLPFRDALPLFTSPGEKEIAAEQWLDVASALPVGVSRAEMQQVFSKIDAENSGKVQLMALEASMSHAASVDCVTPPPFFRDAIKKGLCERLRQELQVVSGASGLVGLARESDFRRVIMQTERYLTADQLNSLVLMADKGSDGRIDFVEFAERFGGAQTGCALRVPGGALPSGPTWPQTASAPPSPEEVRAVGSRAAAVLDRQGFAPERLPALVALWGNGDPNSLPPSAAAALLARLPLGLSQQEAEAQLQTSGSITGVAQAFAELWSEGVWKANCEWAAFNIPGPALRSVLERQVASAECRTLLPEEFARALADAGVAPGNQIPAIWLAEKGMQGDIRIAEFLAAFGGAQPASAAAKKKKGIWSLFRGR